MRLHAGNKLLPRAKTRERLECLGLAAIVAHRPRADPQRQARVGTAQVRLTCGGVPEREQQDAHVRRSECGVSRPERS
jgi:hypothetical protein